MRDQEKTTKLLEQLVTRSFKFNQNHNLFQRKTKEEIYKKDVLECLEINEHIKKDDKILDIGSGGGFPSTTSMLPTGLLVIIPFLHKGWVDVKYAPGKTTVKFLTITL